MRVASAKFYKRQWRREEEHAKRLAEMGSGLIPEHLTGPRTYLQIVPRVASDSILDADTIE